MLVESVEQELGSNRHIHGAGTGEYSVLVGRPRFSEGEMTLRVSVLSGIDHPEYNVHHKETAMRDCSDPGHK